MEVTEITFMRKTSQKSSKRPSSQLSMRILDINMIPIFTKLFVMSMAASKVFGCSSKVTIRLKDGCCFVFKTLMSFDVSEKKATSLPATRNEMISSITIIKMSMVVAAGVIANKRSK